MPTRRRNVKVPYSATPEGFRVPHKPTEQEIFDRRGHNLNSTTQSLHHEPTEYSKNNVIIARGIEIARCFPSSNTKQKYKRTRTTVHSPEKKEITSMNIAALVLGIIAVLVALVPFLGIVAFLPALLGGLFGLIGIVRKKGGRKLAIAGLLLCIVAGFTAGLNFKATDSAVTALDEAVNGKEPLELTLQGVYVESYAGDDYYMLLDIQNISEKTINGFRGYVAFYDEFDALSHKEDFEHLKVIAPGQHLYLGKLVSDGQTLIEELPVLETPTTSHAQIETLRTNKKTKLFCTDIGI